MVKSSLRKNASRTVVTNLVIGFDDAISLTVQNRAQSGGAIYTVPRKGEASFQRILWNVVTNQNPTTSFFVHFAIMRVEAADILLSLNRITFSQKAMLVARQNWENLTSVGVVDTSKTIDVDMDELVIKRDSNLQSDGDFQISTAYLSEDTVSVAQSGTMWIKETLTQKMVRDDTDEWIGYTFEESAQ